jgi:hypothetical protein
VLRSQEPLKMLGPNCDIITDVTAPFVQSRPVHGTGFCVSPHGLPEVPVGIPEGVVLTPGALPAVGGVENVGVVGVVGVPEVCGVHGMADEMAAASAQFWTVCLSLRPVVAVESPSPQPFT